MAWKLPVSLYTGALTLIETRQKNHIDMLLLSVALAFQEKCGAAVIDGGNHYNAYKVIRAARYRSHDLDQLEKIRIARAFNCHQVVSLSKKLPKDGTPCLVIDALDTFEDDGVPFPQRLQLVSLLLQHLAQVRFQAVVMISISPPKGEPAQWQAMARMFRHEAAHRLEEGFMGKTIPTINQIIQQAEVILARFSRALQPEQRQALDKLFVDAKKHIAAISEANHLLPFEAAQQAMLLEQQLQIVALQERLAQLEKLLDHE
jgi:hypothetical protein